MKTKKLSDSELKSRLFARRRYHEAGNHPDGTVEQWRKNEKIGTVLVWIGVIVFTPILIALLVEMERHGPHAPLRSLPWWWIPSLCFVMPISICSCCHVILRFVLPHPCLGRWIIVNAGIFYRYGKSPRRFLPFSSLRNPRVEKPESLFAVVVFDTDEEPLRIAAKADGDRNRIELLPFLNDLIERLKQKGWATADLTPLLKLRRIIHGRLVEGARFPYSPWLSMACYYAALACVLLFYPFICMVPYPAIVWVGAFCGLVACLIGYTLNSRLEYWKNKKIDKILQELAQDERESV